MVKCTVSLTRIGASGGQEFVLFHKCSPSTWDRSVTYTLDQYSYLFNKYIAPQYIQWLLWIYTVFIGIDYVYGYTRSDN